ncbi:MAG: ATP-binding cassette domain-containing protein [Candidatus Levybacteria bacterium]|nr:ATP-binding cassette domain-containing protein [Candidatus Levybacteria bacterium]
MIRLENVTKTFGTGASALIDVTVAIEKGEFVFLVGPSGSGKTTFLRLLIRDMLPSKGTIIVGDWDLTKLPNSKIPHLRKRIGVVFQDLKLLTDRTILENIILPLEMTNIDSKTALKKVEDILSQAGILEHKDKFPVQLSGGELQRVAIARALVFSPEILLADEPTGNLDATTSWEIVKLLQDINALGTTVIMATHNTDIVNNLLKRVVTLSKGSLLKDEKPRPKADQPLAEKSHHEKKESSEKAEQKTEK